MHQHLYSIDDGALESGDDNNNNNDDDDDDDDDDNNNDDDGDDDNNNNDANDDYLLITCILTYPNNSVGYDNTGQSPASFKCPITYIH